MTVQVELELAEATSMVFGTYVVALHGDSRAWSIGAVVMLAGACVAVVVAFVVVIITQTVGCVVVTGTRVCHGSDKYMAT